MGVLVEVMDLAFGRPAEGVPITLLREVDAQWRRHGSTRTGATGRAALPPATPRGRYRLVLDLDGYFPGLGVMSFQSRIDVAFRVFGTGEPVHILLTITPSSSFVCRLDADLRT